MIALQQVYRCSLRFIRRSSLQSSLSLFVDYFILHKRNFTKEQLDDLYDPNGSKAGVNMAAIIATVVGAAIGLYKVDLSFFTATIPTGVIYYLLMKNMKSCENFRKGTTLEK